MLVEAVTQQEVLTAGMLAPERLLDIVRHFTLFKDTGEGRTVKVVCRYQQYRGVGRRRCVACRTGLLGRRTAMWTGGGGIVWHTQGVGQELDDGVLDPGDAQPSRASEVQGRLGHRPD